MYVLNIMVHRAFLISCATIACGSPGSPPLIQSSLNHQSSNFIRMPGPPAVLGALSQQKDILPELSWAPTVPLGKEEGRCLQQVPGPCSRRRFHSWVGLIPRAEHLWPTAWHGSWQNYPLGGRWPVGIPQHGVEGAGKVVGLGAAVVIFGGRQQAGQEQQQQQQQLQW